ncbi:olfactomedin-4-like [Xenentodon cancila]
MKLNAVIALCALFTLTWQGASGEKCTCDVRNTEKEFPHDKLQNVENNVTNCNSLITLQKVLELESLLMGLDLRLDQLNKDVSVLENENDGELYGVLSLYVIENEMIEINQLIDKLNRTTLGHQLLTANTHHQLDEVTLEIQELEKFDTMEVVKGRLENRRLKTNLDQCLKQLNSTAPLIQPQYGKSHNIGQRIMGNCPLGQIQNITGPRVYTQGEFPGKHAYGAWGRDPKPTAGKESWYWLVMMTSSNRYANYVRLYSGLSALIIGVSTPGNVQIHSSNPATNTIQGPNVVLYGGALYYNCYNEYSVCRFNLTSRSITKFQLPSDTRYNSKGNFCHLEQCYPYTDLDLATDESGVWVTYTTNKDYGNLVLSKVEENEPLRLGQTWRTSVYKQSMTNTFMACGILYATRYVNKSVEEIFYSFNTITGKENFNVGIFMNKMAANILSLNYSPVDQMLHAYSDSHMVSYKVFFE